MIPIIFAQSIIIFPSTLASFFPGSEVMQTVQQLFGPGSVLYNVLYGLLIIFFTYFYTAIVVNPVDMAENMKKVGGFVPGVQPGKHTAEYIDRILLAHHPAGGDLPGADRGDPGHADAVRRTSRSTSAAPACSSWSEWRSTRCSRSNRTFSCGTTTAS